MDVRAIGIALRLTFAAGPVAASDWPSYLGPKRDGTSTETNLLRTWPKDGPTVLWTVPVGRGYGGPVVSGGKVYLLDRDDAVGDRLRCFDLATGKELWSFAYDAPGRSDHPGSRTTPAVDGDFVYTSGSHGQLYAIDTKTQKPAWHKNPWSDFGGGSLPRWALTQNPLVYKDLVIVAAQTPQTTVVAYDKLTGDVKWKSPVLPGGVGYVSPSIVRVGGEDHLVMVMAARGWGRSASGGGVSGLDPRSGSVLWTYTGWQCGIPVPHAVDAGDGRMLITGGYSAGAALIRVQKAAGGYSVTELFKNPDFGAHTQPPILYKGHFYVPYTINERSDGLVCMSLDGKVLWRTGDDPSFNKGGAALADGLLFSVDGNRRLYLIEPDPSGFKPLASVEILEPGENWAPIALADGRLLIRDQAQMKCLQVARQVH